MLGHSIFKRDSNGHIVQIAAQQTISKKRMSKTFTKRASAEDDSGVHTIQNTLDKAKKSTGKKADKSTGKKADKSTGKKADKKRAKHHKAEDDNYDDEFDPKSSA
jgi:hypothetical protein